ncbi:MAG: hypothetical protein AB7P14_18080 [Blastocatellales bacterium]
MLRRQLSVVTMIITLALSTAAMAFADCQKRTVLSIPATGNRDDLSGVAEARSVGKRQRFRVSMDARVAEGTTYSVYADGILAGVVIIDAFGVGELEISNDNGKPMPAAVNPVCAIRMVEVRDLNGIVVLSGNF